MKIKFPIRFKGSRGEKDLITYFDRNSPFSFIDAGPANVIADSQKLFRPLNTNTSEANNYINVFDVILADFYINKVRMSDEFYIVHHLKENAIVGATTIRKWRMKFDLKNARVIIDHRIAKPILIDLGLVYKC